MSDRVAVVLCNLGGPDSLAAVRPFLFNLFSDPDIFRLPLGWLTQRPFASLIAWRRAPEAAHGYAAIGGKSPILEYTQAQAGALQKVLDGAGQFDVHVCMRYWHPLTDAVVATLKQKNYARVILLPLYPHYSITTTGSAYNEFQRQCERQHYQPAVTLVRQWYDQPDYQAAIVETLRAELKKFPDPDPARIELLFSAHGLPQKIVDGGDPYERQIRATFDAVRTQLGWPNTTLCYQSRVGPLEWLRPYIQDVIRDKAAKGAKQMLVYPIAFVSDHVETLFELGITYAELARAQGITHYRVTPALNNHPRFIAALKSLVLNAASTP
ncbi:MAG: ferrochelatase [Sulfuricaulis sp.]|uniref:ferrochelatase n=1 Tax=Sulfuricaulis sp. TaxID=2003553 RepID=UPI0025E024FA|nr:ferrochelatase [Sulfuricaulis sp.]MCR4347847.1 ferrochelatase [Sulfuricaulis sp.]